MIEMINDLKFDVNYKVRAVDKLTGDTWLVGKRIPFGYDTTENVSEAVYYSKREIEAMGMMYSNLVIIPLDID